MFKKHLRKGLVSVSWLFKGFAPVRHFGRDQQPGLCSVPLTNPQAGCNPPNPRALSNFAQPLGEKRSDLLKSLRSSHSKNRMVNPQTFLKENFVQVEKFKQ